MPYYYIIPQEAIQRMFGKLQPENHKFFCFARDCLVHLTQKIGMQDASKKLEISMPVINAIVKHSANLKIMKRSLPPAKPYEKDDRIKDQIVDFYASCRSISKVSKTFDVPKEKAIKWILESLDSIS
jgi:hypothetical protein